MSNLKKKKEELAKKYPHYRPQSIHNIAMTLVGDEEPNIPIMEKPKENDRLQQLSQKRSYQKLFHSQKKDVIKDGINKQDHLGRSKLHWAVYDNNLDLVKKLVENGASLDILDNSRNTPFSMAVRDGKNAIVKFLLEPHHRS